MRKLAALVLLVFLAVAQAQTLHMYFSARGSTMVFEEGTSCEITIEYRSHMRTLRDIFPKECAKK